MFFDTQDSGDSEVLAALNRDSRAGYSPTEVLERNGLLSPSDEVSAKPWEISENTDVA